jgi:exopolysaccharide biosynthesis polyprenyl glycosylphosphotransferase
VLVRDRQRERTTEERPRANNRRLSTSIANVLLPRSFTNEARSELWPVLLNDFVVILGSWLGAAAIVAITDQPRAVPSSAWLMPEILSAAAAAALLFSVVATLFGYSEGLYQSDVGRRYRTLILAKSVAWTMIVLAVTMRGISAFSVTQLVLSAGLSFGSLLISRELRDRVQRTSHASSNLERNVLIVGAGAAGREVAGHLERHPELKRVVCGFLDDSGPGFDVLGPATELATIARAKFADEIIIAEPHPPALAQYVIREARRNHLDVKVVPYFYACNEQPLRLENLGRVPLITLHREKLPAGELFLKRVLDLAISSFCLILTTPLLLSIAIMIKLDSKGSALYGALRVGRKGRRFRCFKFRTMVRDAGKLKDALRSRNQREGPCFKVANDPRVTRVGRWLRRYSLDELPQLWNVWRGEMSLVGPRPHPVDDFARYDLEHFRRLDVTPGITGLWQVTARRNPSFQATMALDLEYIEKWSLGMDLRILLKTAGVVFRGTGE